MLGPRNKPFAMAVDIALAIAINLALASKS